MLRLLLAITFLVSPSAQVYFNLGWNPVSTAYDDYTEAFGSHIFNTAYGKTVTYEPDVICDPSFVFFAPVGTYKNFTEVTPDLGYQVYTRRCKKTCDPPPSSNITDITSESSRNSLQSGQNVAVAESNHSTTYVLTLSSESVSEGESTLLTAVIKQKQFSMNVLLKVNTSRDENGVMSCDLKVEHQQRRVFTKLDVEEPNQMAIMSDGGKGVAFLLNQRPIYSLTNASLIGLTLTAATDVFSYNIDNWMIFNQTLNTQQLHMLTSDTLLPYNPMPESGPECQCPLAYPIFQRWPKFNGDSWTGVFCTSVGGDKSVRRIDKEASLPQYITDGDFVDFYMSAKDVQTNILTIDLGTDYQIFYARLTLETLPKYIMLTKLRRLDDAAEEVLFVVSPNCSVPLNNSLLQNSSFVCKDYVQLFLSEGTDKSRVLMMDWTTDILYPDVINKDQAGFDRALSEKRFEARYVKLYLQEFEVDISSRHVINEFEVYGSCACGNGAECRPNSAVNNDGPDNYTSRVYTTASFEAAAGYSCRCRPGYKGHLCLQCADDSYKPSDGECIPCDCGAGALNESCDNEGQCQCSLNGAGTKPDLADDKCRPFVHSFSPSIGPVSGGTNVMIEGAWLDAVDYVNLGSMKCHKLRNESYNDTSFYCKTPPSASRGTYEVYAANSYPLVNFTYMADPNITVIGRINVFAKGGVDISVRGTNLQVIAKPMIVVTITCISTGEEVTSVKGNCTTLSSEEMNCKSPDLTGVLENDRCGQSTRRRKRATDINSLYEFSIGFLLDGVETFEDASESPWLKESAQLFISPDPSIDAFRETGRILQLAKNDRQIEITGANLNTGAMLEDYTVTIGVGGCKSLFLYSERLTCKLPEVLPEAGDDNVPHPDNPDIRIPSVIVSVGNIKTHVGYVAGHIKAGPVLAIALGTTAAIVVIVIAIFVGIFIMRRRSYHPHMRPQGSKSGSRYVRGPHGMYNAGYLDSELMETLDKWMIPHEHLEIGKDLGQGQFGKVFLGSLEMQSGATNDVAVKTIKADLLRSDPNAVSNFLQEAILMKDFDHPNVLALIGVVVNQDDMPLVITPFMSKGDLKHVLRDEDEEFTVGDLIHFGLQAANGMSYLAKKKFIHRDLAARNCMVDGQFMLRIADFGMSHDIYAEDYYRVQDRTKPLPVKWMSIESLTSGRYTVESDVWSYGVLLWEIMTRGATPYPGINNYDVKQHLQIGRRLDPPEVCPQELYDLMCACWEMLPINRPQFDKIGETLQAFLDENSDYHREQTKEIETDYYTMPIEEKPVYVNDITFSPETKDGLTSDYDIAEPVELAPGSPQGVRSKYFKAYGSNSNNNNSDRWSIERGQVREHTVRVETDSYLAPAPSVKAPAPSTSMRSGQVTSQTKVSAQKYSSKSKSQEHKSSAEAIRYTQPVAQYSKEQESVSLGDMRKNLKPVNRNLMPGKPDNQKRSYVDLF